MSTKALPEILDPTTSRESLSSAKLGTSADDGRHPTYENLGFGIVASGLPKDRQELLVDLSFGIWDKARTCRTWAMAAPSNCSKPPTC